MATEADKTNNGVLGTIVVVGALAVLSVALAVTAMVRAEVTKLNSEQGANADLNTVREFKDGERNVLASPAHWADRSKGLAAIPIDLAMSLVTRDLRKHPNLATPTLPSAKTSADAGVEEDPGAGGESGELGAAGAAAAPGASAEPHADPAPQPDNTSNPPTGGQGQSSQGGSPATGSHQGAPSAQSGGAAGAPGATPAPSGE